MPLKKILVLLLVVGLIAAFYWFDGGQYLSLEIFQQWFAENPLQTAIIYFALYVLVTALSLPGATIVTLLGGAVFGLWWGVLLVSFASSIGATLAFLVSRTLLGDTVNKKFGQHLEKINQGVEKEGAFYLFTLRLIPIIPFFVINLVFGLTKIKTWTFYWVSQLGMLAGTVVFVNAGAQLATLENVQGILSPNIIGAFVLLGIFPFIIRALIDKFRHHQVYKAYEKPKSFDTNLVVIGAGSAGLVSSYIAAAVKAKVTLIERHKMGGDCLNTGCVPSKALIRAAKTKHLLKNADGLGIENATADVNFNRVMKRIDKVIKTIEPHDSVERYSKLGVDCVQGDATIISPYAVKVGDKTITTKNIIIASGARPFVPPIPGLDSVDALTSDNLWQLEEQPKRLLIMGAGPIGCELAQSFQRLGTEVTLVDMADRMMPREDEDVSAYMLNTFQAEGVNVLLGQQIIGFEQGDHGYIARVKSANGDDEQVLETDRVLVAVGRKANTENMGLETLGIEVARQGTVVVDDYLRTKYPNIYACGDVAGPYQFTHTAAHQAWYASVNALFGKLKKFRVDYKVIPWATFTDPEVARVGLSESEAKEKSIEYDVTRYDIDDLDRAIADDEAKGFVKVLTAKGSDRILGCTIVGAHGGELITEFVTAMKHNIGLNKILGTIHIYPTMSEANKYVAGEWKRANVSERTMRWLQKFHHWMRG